MKIQKRIMLLVLWAITLTCHAGTFISFENPQSVGAKTNYAMQHGLRGVMVWHAGQDQTGLLSQAIKQHLKFGKEFIMYVPDYSFVPSRGYYIEDLEKLLSDCPVITTLIYSFAKPHGDGHVSFECPPQMLLNETMSIRKQVVALKKKFPHIAILVSLGGWAYKDGFFEAIKEKRLKKLAFNALRLVKKWGFDGIDIDWEFDANQDELNLFGTYFLPFISYIRQAMESSEQSNKILTVALSPAEKFYTKFSDFSALVEKIDWINLMTYNYEGPGWSEITGHNAPLYAPSQPHFKRKWKVKGHKFESIDSSIKGFLNRGVPRDKIVLGIPFYGRVFAGVSKGYRHGLYQPHSGIAKIPELAPAGTVDYTTLQGKVPLSSTDKVLDCSFKYYWDNQSKVPYLFSPVDYPK